jgi:acid stress chaperone HdeB
MKPFLRSKLPRTGFGAALLASVLWTSLAHGQVTVDFTKLTCDQYLYSKMNSQNLSLWLSGYFHGKRNDPVVDVQAWKDSGEKMRRFCLQNSNAKVPVMDAIERVLIKAQ